MDIRLHRKNMEVPAALRDAASRKLAKLESFLDDSGWVEVGFVEEQNPRIAAKYHCEIVAHVKGHRLKVEGAAGESLMALDAAVDKLEEQVRRLKDRRVTSRHPRKSGGNHSASGAVPAERAPRTRRPVIVREDEVDSKPMTPEEAVMQLDALERGFLPFVNAETGSAAVVYRRPDGNYGLVEVAG